MTPVIGIVTDFDGHLSGLINDGIRHAAAELGVTVLIYGSTTLASFAQLDGNRVSRWSGLARVDGFVFPFANRAMLEHAAALHARGVPVMILSRQFQSIPRLVADSREAVLGLMKEWVGRGHRRILFLAGPKGNYSADDRLEAYRAACRETGAICDPALIVEADYDQRIAQNALLERLAGHVEFSAVLGCDDLCALGAISALREKGVKVPADVEVVGFDNKIRAMLSNPPLSTFEFPSFQLGYTAVKKLVRHLRGEEPLTSETLPMHFIRRASTRAPDVTGTSAEVPLSASERQNEELLSLLRQMPVAVEGRGQHSVENLRNLSLKVAATEQEIVSATAEALHHLCVRHFGLFLADAPSRDPSQGRLLWWHDRDGRLEPSEQRIDLRSWDPSRYLPQSQNTSWALMSLQCADEQLGLAVMDLEQVRVLRVHEIAAQLAISLKIVRLNRELESINGELVSASRAAGMAEIATSVLHNVGNVLNSVNVSATVVADGVRKLRLDRLEATAAMLTEHAGDATEFLTQDARGKLLPGFLKALGEASLAQRETILAEIRSLQEGIDHIKVIVAMQQSYASTVGVVETISADSMMEDALRMSALSLERHRVQVVRRYTPAPPIVCERPKVLQILANLIQNAKQACDEAAASGKCITVQVEPTGSDRVRLVVRDNGIGISSENLQRVFNHGFTTRKEGHGFGLHWSALAAKQMSGSLSVASAGPHQGATFTLELPISAAPEKAK